MTQDELAKYLGVSRTMVVEWEKGKYIPQDSTLEKLMRLFGVDRNIVTGRIVLHYEPSNIRWTDRKPSKSDRYLAYVRRTNGLYEYVLLDYSHNADKWEEKDTTYVNLLTGARVSGYREFDGEVLQWTSFPPCDADIIEIVAKPKEKKK